MTNTETVSTERLGTELREVVSWLLNSRFPGNEHIAVRAADKINRAADALASRTQSPAEPVAWVTKDILAAMKRGERAVPGWKPSADFCIPIYAGSIPAPERSKEEAGVKVKPLEWRHESWGRSNKPEVWRGYGAHGLFAEVAEFALGDDRRFRWLVVGSPVEHASLEAAKGAAQADYEQRIRSALETPPLHKEGQAVAADRAMRGGEPCGWPECGCDFDAKCSDAPVPVPVTITDEMVERLARHYAENHGVPPDEPLYEGSEQLAWHAWVDDARAALITALSAKPGEQG